MRRRQLRKDMDAFAEVYNAAWSKNWDFVPYSKKDLDAYAQELQLVFDKHWFMIAENESTPARSSAMAITFPDLNQVLAKMNGRLLPLGWWHFLRKGRIIDRVRVGFLGVKPEYQHTGVAAKLYRRTLQRGRVRPQKGGEMGWILETNTAMNRGMEAMGGRGRQALPRVRAHAVGSASLTVAVYTSRGLSERAFEPTHVGRGDAGTGAIAERGRGASVDSPTCRSSSPQERAGGPVPARRGERGSALGGR